jgi:pyridoxine/pyridoxamine 5'-phosphate oxidase
MIAAMARHSHDPIAKFIRWLEDARRARIPNYEAMALATAARSGKTSVRFVLLKGIDQRGFMFFTDARSRKGRELRGNPHGSLALYWQPKGRQVRAPRLAPAAHRTRVGWRSTPWYSGPERDSVFWAAIATTPDSPVSFKSRESRESAAGSLISFG